MRIQNMGKTRGNMSPTVTAIPLSSEKASIAPEKTDKALNLEDKVITAICVLSPNSAIVTSANDAARAAKPIEVKVNN